MLTIQAQYAAGLVRASERSMEPAIGTHIGSRAGAHGVHTPSQTTPLLRACACSEPDWLTRWSVIRSEFMGLAQARSHGSCKITSVWQRSQRIPTWSAHVLSSPPPPSPFPREVLVPAR